MTWLNSPAWQSTKGNSGSKWVCISATYFHTLRATVMVVSMAWLMSINFFSSNPGCEKSFMARTILVTR